jgi:beta-phosphoglucomutase
MIKAVIFDLDGTLVDTERLKGVSYGRAANELRPGTASDAQAIEAFKDVLGRSRREAGQALLERFGVASEAQARMTELGADDAVDAFIRIRLRIYDEMVSNAEVMRRAELPHTVALVRTLRAERYPLGLTTQSDCKRTLQLMAILGLQDAFGVMVTGDEVTRGKPDPQIYEICIGKLGVLPAECLALEDAAVGIKAALAAGVWCIAVPTDLTRAAIDQERLLDECWIVSDPARLEECVREMFAAHQQD